MNVLFITSEFLDHKRFLYPGGLATYTYNVSKILIQNGISVSIFSLGSQTESFKFEAIDCYTYRNSTYRIKKILKLIFLGKLNATISKILDAYVIFRGTKNIIGSFDIIHITNWRVPGFFISKRRNFVLRISSYEKLLDNQPDILSLDKWISQKLEMHEISEYVNIIGPGNYILEKISQELGKQGEFLPSPYFIQSTNNDFIRERRKFLYVGTLSYIKGVDLLFEIIEAVLRTFPNSEFIVVGKISQVKFEIISAIINSVRDKYTNRFNHFSHLSKTDLVELYQKSETLLIPSVHDNFPNVALEAMANECIVVASSTASLETLIQSGENGYIVEDRYLESWLAVLNRIDQMSFNELREFRIKMGDSLKQFSPEIAGKALIDYYNRVLINCNE